MGRRKFLTVRQVADILGMSEWTMREWCRDGKLPATKIGKSWRVHEDEFNQLLEKMHG